MSGKRIGYFIETGIPGGAEVVMFKLARIARDYGYEVVVFHFEHAWIQAQCNEHGIKSIELPFRKSFKSTLRLPFFAVQFSMLLRKEHIDILHSHLFGPIIGGGLSGFLAGVPHIATLHDVYMLEEKPRRSWLLRCVALLGTKFVTVSNHMRDYYVQRCNLANSDIRTVYNYCDTLPSQIDAERSRPIKVIVVGRLIALKRVDRVIRSCLSSPLFLEQARLQIVGEGEDSDTLKGLVPEDARANVEFLGRREDVRDLLLGADIFVQYSETEGLSMSILEAIASGLPAIVSDVGGNSELVLHGVNGYLVSKDDDKELRKRIEELIEDDLRRKKMGTEGLAHASRDFSLERFSTSYIEMYNSLL